jgi:hypothetical protein
MLLIMERAMMKARGDVVNSLGNGKSGDESTW